VHGNRSSGALTVRLGRDDALQSQRCPSSPYPARAPPCHKLAGLLGPAAQAWRHRAVAGPGRCRRLVRAQTQHPRRPASLFRPCDPISADAASDGPPRPAPSPGDAYDGDPVYQAAAARQPGPPSEVIVSPRASAVPSGADPTCQNSRDRHIKLMAQLGRIGGGSARPATAGGMP